MELFSDKHELILEPLFGDGAAAPSRVAEVQAVFSTTEKGYTMKSTQIRRRQFLKFGSAALAIIPVVAFSGSTFAATNAAMRASLKYQDKPEGDKHCATCLQFVPGKTAKDNGGCKLMPGDTEISPQGYCTAWTKK